jgi:hypothetical protein
MWLVSNLSSFQKDRKLVGEGKKIKRESVCEHIGQKVLVGNKERMREKTNESMWLSRKRKIAWWKNVWWMKENDCWKGTKTYEEEIQHRNKKTL